MINYNQVQKIASDLSLPEKTIEKDYFIELLLYYISLNNDLEELIFRGGTCLKKIYFPNYRFSEDLDFLVKSNLTDLTKYVSKVLNGLNSDFPVESEEIKEKRVLKNNRLQIFFTYNIVPEILSKKEKILKVDIVKDNFIPPIKDRSLKFSYKDLKGLKSSLLSYDLESIIADKIGRLLDVVNEPRDIYDLWKLMKKDLDFEKILKVFENKHGYSLNINALISEVQKSNYMVDWERRLSHQIADLPDFKKVRLELRNLIKQKLD